MCSRSTRCARWSGRTSLRQRPQPRRPPPSPSRSGRLRYLPTLGPDQEHDADDEDPAEQNEEREEEDRHEQGGCGDEPEPRQPLGHRTRSKTDAIARRKSSQSGMSLRMNLRSVCSASCSSSWPDLRNTAVSSSSSRSRVRKRSVCRGQAMTTTGLPRRRPVCRYNATASARASGSRCSWAKCRFTGASMSRALTGGEDISDRAATKEGGSWIRRLGCCI